MAVIWQKKINGTRYEVRKAGNSIRLFTDDVFHSQFNPNHPITRSVWDLLMLPAFFYEPGTVKRVLVLGVGGGSVIRLLHTYVQPDQIVGIELVPVHISIARRFFGVTKRMADLVQADAIAWMKHYRGPRFDMIIDDLFGEEQGEGVRPVALDTRWFNLLHRNLSANGMLVFNSVVPRPLMESAYFTNPAVAGKFTSAFRLSLPSVHNAVGAFLKKASSARQLRQHIGEIPGLNSKSGPNKLPFRIQDLTRKVR